jgi:polygalacturonase
MKTAKRIKFAMMVLIAGAAGLGQAAEPAGEVPPPFPMPDLVAPVFPEQSFNIANFGAIADGKTKNTAAFAAAIEACSKAGGGSVLVPAGTWFTGPIILQSHVNLHLEKGAVVSFSSDPNDYGSSVFAGLGDHARPGLICNNEGEDIALTGDGEFIGNGEMWWKPVQAKIAERKRLKVQSDPRMSTIPASYAVVDPKTGKKGKIGRPTFVSFNNSKNILIDGPTFRDGPIFMVHPNSCEEVIIRNIHVFSAGGPNTDGIDPNACTNVLIENCYLDTGDDCLVIKSERGRSAENIVIRNLTTHRGHGGIVVGSTTEGGVRNVFADNCHFDGTDTGIRIKSNRLCGGVVENLWLQNIEMGTILTQAITMDMWYHDKKETLAPHPGTMPVYRNIHIKNVTCQNAAQAIYLKGLPESPIHDITLENVSITAQKGSMEQYTKNIVETNVKINVPPSVTSR